MSKRWLVALLLISFSFNLAVIGSAIYLRLTMPCPMPGPAPGQQMMPPRPESGMMGRDPEIQQLRQRFDDSKVTLMKELAKDPVDEVKINAIIDSSLVVQSNLEHRLGKKILAYRKTMTAAEAREHFQRRADNMKNRSRRFDRIKHRRQP